MPFMAPSVGWAMVDDIRSAGADQHWDQFGEAWTALLTYRYLGKVSPGVDAGVEVETMPLRHDMRNPTGGVMAAPMVIASPEPYWLDDECVPAPVVMSYEIVDPARDVDAGRGAARGHPSRTDDGFQPLGGRRRRGS